ncbi:sulfite reductase subunit C [Fuchsiella alkaliacetigena]|uniref:sulfite reductase subunit C n=1 Tax=Fuchsiella alkaliacetigena TaxID=957042 RepID=UPI00200B86FC|nr:sulfite reductase subunit C [Fuchsiella alkaliacetigena]MCK8824802.1 sulfite reductase subunit C [Fuchsiella alkaliacetigena]
MEMDQQKVRQNAYRITNQEGKVALRVRVPGGHLKAEYLSILEEIAQDYGNGTLHITSRQGFEIPELDWENIELINKKISPLLKGLKEELGVKIVDIEAGYPAAGTRNIIACIGDRVCRLSHCDATEFAQEIERAIYPDHRNLKVGISGCANDCMKVHLQDFGIIAMIKPLYIEERCIDCDRCVEVCRDRARAALSYQGPNLRLDNQRCIGCGECISECPTGAWRGEGPYYKLLIMGRTGKKNPRLASTFLKWTTKEVIIQILNNAYQYIDKHIDSAKSKEYISYIVDRTGYPLFKEELLQNVELNSEAQLTKHINFK